MAQTAIDLFAKELYEKFEMKGDGKLFDQLFIHYKEMEKENILNAWARGVVSGGDATAEQYYNETFKNNL